MAIARRSKATASSATSTNVLTTTWDVTPVDGDTLVALVVGLVQTTITPPAGWTQVQTQDSGSALRGWLFTKAAAGESSSNLWTLGTNTKCFAATAGYSGADFSTVVTGSNNGVLVTPSLTVPANGWLFTAAGARHAAAGAGASTWTTSDGSDLELLDFGSNAGSGNDIAGGVYDSNRALAAGSYTRTLTSSKSEVATITFAVAVGPTGAAPPPAGTGARWGVHL